MLWELADWTVSLADRPAGTVSLFILSFAESSFFPIPPDLLQIALSLHHPELSFWYALVSAVASTSGGLFGHFLGRRLGRPLLTRFFAEEKVLYAEHLFGKHDVWAVAIAGFTPIPYKLFTIASGVLRMRLWRFLLVSFVSRAARFLLVATATYFWGQAARGFLAREFNWLTLALFAGVGGGFYAVKLLARCKARREHEDS